MAELIRQVEAEPTSYPDAPDGLSSKAAAVDAAMIWSRIEAYSAYRYTSRAVVWTVEGFAGDEFCPPLAPLVSFTAERWWDAEWTAVDLVPGPIGLVLPSDGMFRISGIVGAGDIPAPVSEAFRRLAEYLAGARNSTSEPGASSVKSSITGDLEFEVERNPAWVARAMQYSGAGDLLRNFRRVQ